MFSSLCLVDEDPESNCYLWLLPLGNSWGPQPTSGFVPSSGILGADTVNNNGVNPDTSVVLLFLGLSPCLLFDIRDIKGSWNIQYTGFA